MAKFTVEFARGELPGPTYEDYFVGGPLGVCGDDARQHPIKFNDIATGDYVVGFNWDNPSGLPPGEIRIISFSDSTITVELSTNTVVNTQLSPANTLKDNMTGLNLTYPYTTLISNLPNIVEDFAQPEITCYNIGNTDYRNIRTRVVEYVLFDTAGNAGPICKAIYQNIAP